MRKWTIRLAALLAVSTLVFAAERQVSWLPPTMYTDGSALLEQDLDFYTLRCNGATIATIDSVIGTNTWTAPDGTFTPGDWSCTLSVTSVAGVESAESNPYVFTVGPLVPMAPINLVIQL